jgi:upstream activation factor subunit UAF30
MTTLTTSSKSTKTSQNEKKMTTSKASTKKVEPTPVVEQPPTPVIVEETTSTVVDDASSTSDKYKRQKPTRDLVLQQFEDIVADIEKEIDQIRDNDSKSTKGIKFLRSINKRIKLLRNQSARLIKNKRNADGISSTQKKNNSNNSGFLKPVKISKEMAKFTGWNEDELRSRVQVTKWICDYIKTNNLQNPEDRRQINVDTKLSKLLKYDTKKETQPLTYYALQKHLKSHFIKPEVVSA